MRSILTAWNNRLYRSRTEARWAVVFDHLGIPFDYELDGKIINGTAYLADFWIPHLNAWIEIKGGTPTADEWSKARRLCGASGHPVYVFPGSIRVTPASCSEVPAATRIFPSRDVAGETDEDWGYSWCQCSDCDGFGIEFQGRSDRLACKAGRSATGKCPCYGDRGITSNSPALMDAYREAMMMQFEFGATAGRP